MTDDDDPCGSPQTLPLNAYETTEAIVLVAPMPAVQVEDIHVSVDARTVTIAADCRTEARKDYLLHEWHYGPYERTFDLPGELGYGAAEATFGNGQLAVRVLKGSGAGDGDVQVVKK